MSSDERYKVGQLVVSCKGRDMGRYYLIVRVEEDFLWLADGTYRPLNKLKKKRKKHTRNPFHDILAMEDTAIFLNSREGSGDGDKAIRDFIAKSKKIIKENA